MNKARDIRNIILGAVGAVSGFSALAAVNLTSFAPGTPIKSSEVNANFSSLKANIEALQAPNGVSGTQLAAGSVDASKLSSKGGADGKVLKLQAGNLAWADDLTGGTGGTAYSAGGGLALTGTTFSLADSGVTAGKLSASGGMDGKVLKLSGGNLTWSDDLVGSAGTTYKADGSSLALTGATFSIKDGGVSTAKIADGSVTGAKIAFGLNLSGNSDTAAFTITNTNANGSGLRVDLGNQSAQLTTAAAIAVRTTSAAGVYALSPSNTAVYGETATQQGVYGRSSGAGVGVLGLSSSGLGVQGISSSSIGVQGQGDSGIGVRGESNSNIGILGASNSNIGILGSSNSSIGVQGKSGSNAGVYGKSITNVGVYGASDSYYGVYGTSSANNAVYGVTIGSNTNIAALASTSAVGYAAYFEAGSAVCKFHAGTTDWACASDRNLKENFRPVNNVQVLEAVARMPVTTWSMKGSKIRQMGPTAQDFYAAFKLGDSDTMINNTDAKGVALAAIKGLNTKLETENAALKRTLEALEARLMALEKTVRSR